MAKQRFMARDDSNSRMALAHTQIATLPNDLSNCRGSWKSLFRLISVA